MNRSRPRQHYRRLKSGKVITINKGRMKKRKRANILEIRSLVKEKGSPAQLQKFDIKHNQELKRLSEAGIFPEEPGAKYWRVTQAKKLGLDPEFRFWVDIDGAKAATRQRQQEEKKKHGRRKHRMAYWRSKDGKVHEERIPLKSDQIKSGVELVSAWKGGHPFVSPYKNLSDEWGVARDEFIPEAWGPGMLSPKQYKTEKDFRQAFEKIAKSKDLGSNMKYIRQHGPVELSRFKPKYVYGAKKIADIKEREIKEKR